MRRQFPTPHSARDACSNAAADQGALPPPSAGGERIGSGARTEHPGLTGYRLDDQIGFLLRCAYQRASGNLMERIGAHGLTPPQFATLARLRERGPVSQNLLGRLVGMEPANIRDVVQRLQRQGLVQTEPAADDRRRRLVRLTARGHALVETLLPLEVASSARTLAPLAPSERKELLRLLARIVKG